MDINVITSLDEFVQLKPVWDDLLDKCGNDNLQLKFSWLYNVSRHFNLGNKLLILIVTENKQVIGIAPFIKIRRYIKKTIPYSQIMFIGNQYSDWNDFIIIDKREKFFEIIFNYLVKQNYGEIILHNIPEDSPNIPPLKKSILNEKYIFREQTKCYYINISNQSWLDYYESTSKKFVKRDLNRLYNAINKLNWRVVESDLSDTSHDLEIIKKLHTFSQERRGGTAYYNNQKYFEFVESFVKDFKKANYTKLYYLLIDNNPIAFMFCFIYNGVFYWWNTGFDINYAKLSPSKILLKEILNKCFNDQNLKEFNFMRGNSDYKTKWTKNYRVNYKVRIFNSKGIYGIINKFRNKSRD